MDRAGILKLLDTMETRIQRIEKAFTSQVSSSANELRQLLRDLSLLARRCRSKVDVLRSSDLADVRAKIDEIGYLSSSRDLNVRLLYGAYDNQLASDALKDDAVYLGNLLNGIQLGLNLTADELLDILPAQKPAAVRFGYDNDNQQIVVVDEPFRPAAKQEEMAVAALEEIIAQGNEVNDDLQRTNAAPRLKSAFARLQERLISHVNIVQVGQSNGTASRVLKAYVDELSLSQFEQLRAHVEGVGAVLAQFPEWRLFCENASSAVLDDAAIVELRAQTVAIEQRLRETARVSEEVSKALTDVVDWVGDGTHPDHRDVLSLVRTQENLWSLLTRNALAKGVKDEATKIAARLIVVAVLGVTGVAFAAIISKVPGAEWVEPTIAFLRANIGNGAPK
jgi:hypothetical protein